MKKISIAKINIYIVNKIFNWRFWIAGLSKKSKTMKKIIDRIVFDKDEIIVIPNTININKKIENPTSEFLPTKIIKNVIEKCDDIVIMNNCLCRTSNDCKDYPQDIGCIFLGPTSKKIPRTLCHEATKEEALKQVDLADEAGLTHIIGRNKIDTLWLNVHPGEGLLTVCHCCPCCCLWKVYPNLDTEISDKIEKLDGVNVNYNEENCVKCMKCLDNICMFNAISLKDNKISIDTNHCRACGLCVNTCKVNGLTIDYNDNTINNIVNRIYNLIEE